MGDEAAGRPGSHGPGTTAPCLEAFTLPVAFQLVLISHFIATFLPHPLSFCLLCLRYHTSRLAGYKGFENQPVNTGATDREAVPGWIHCRVVSLATIYPQAQTLRSEAVV